MSLRQRSLLRPVEFLHDGDALRAEWNEPLAHSLVANERLVLARSPKLHRPRGPYCLRAACDGCLVRVDGVPNVMACRYRVRGGETVETQNVMGSREVDLLQATDFLFPEGFDHHRLFAGVRGVSRVVALLARRIAGLGRLPEQERAVRDARQLPCEVLIVGGGGAGLAAAAELGDRALLVDDGLELGGTFALVDPARAAGLVASARNAGAALHSGATALGIYSAEPGAAPTVLLADERGVAVIRPSIVILATGAHERPPHFPGNDLPGIFGVRAGLALLRTGIVPGHRIAVVGSGPLARLAAELCAERLTEHIARPGAVLAAKGTLRVQELLLGAGEGETRVTPVDAVLVDGELSPALELALQAGGRARFDAQLGYLPELDANGAVAPNTLVVGRASGDAAEPAAQGAALGRSVAAKLSAR